MRDCIVGLLGIVGLMCVGGCEIPAQTFWSPDGSKAAYIPSAGGSAIVFDQNGKILATFGKSMGGAAWSGDGKRLYVAQVVENAGEKAEVAGNWAKSADEASAAPTSRPADENKSDEQTVISVWDGQNAKPLFALGQQPVGYMLVSPDEKWLAITTWAADEKELSYLYVYSLASKRLYLLSVGNPPGMVFTGANRLAFVEPEVKNRVVSQIGALVEVDLDEQQKQLERHELAYVITARMNWLQAVGEDILLTTMQVQLPTTRPTDEKDEETFALYRYGRKSEKLTWLAGDVGLFFAVSPDGKQALVERHEGDKKLLAVMDTAAGTFRDLGPATITAKDGAGNEHTGMPAFAAWRGNGEVSFVDASKAPVEQEKKLYFELALYRLGAKLERMHVLSTDWPVEEKPFVKTGD